MAVDGWFRLYRKLIYNPVFQNEKILKVFIWCLCKASHEEHEQLIGLQKIVLESGQFVYGRIKAAKELNLKESTLNKYMKWLEKSEIINIKSNNKYSLVSIVNWGLYQADNKKSNSKRNNNVTTKEQQSNTNKNVKNVKNEKKKDIDIYSDFTLNEKLKTTLKEFEEMRTRIKKPLTDRAKTMLLNNLVKLSTDEEMQIKILEQSILKCWSDIYEIKSNDTYRRVEFKSAFD